MNAERIKIYTDTSSLRVYLFQAHLSEQEIHSEILNKSDSSYGGSFGEYELYVYQDDATKALQLLEQFLAGGS